MIERAQLAQHGCLQLGDECGCTAGWSAQRSGSLCVFSGSFVMLFVLIFDQQYESTPLCGGQPELYTIVLSE
jgi:hypothetical protein